MRIIKLTKVEDRDNPDIYINFEDVAYFESYSKGNTHIVFRTHTSRILVKESPEEIIGMLCDNYDDEDKTRRRILHTWDADDHT
jgi:predicted transcriptional regulator YheO